MARLGPDTQPAPVSRAPSDSGSGGKPPKPKIITKAYPGDTAIVDLAGEAVIAIQVPSGVDSWEIERMRVKTNSVLISAVELFRNSMDDMHSLDFTPSGNNDVADNSKPPYFRSGDTIYLKWTGATPGAIAKASMQVKVTQ
jgi:hypothetical protein